MVSRYDAAIYTNTCGYSSSSVYIHNITPELFTAIFHITTTAMVTARFSFYFGAASSDFPFFFYLCKIPILVHSSHGI